MTTSRPGVSEGADEAEVLAELTDMIQQVLGGYALQEGEVTMRTRFGRDLELESIDLVTLAGLLEERYGRAVNFAEFVADMELEEIIELDVGRLVEHICLCLKAPDAARPR
ncbi:acyl carrier protein [Streptomyces ficellus]|uniref:Acyl carrier protein n=1 Tax=Streptomyces ficellus TaxID=1977088 RepID=A0A6I6FWN1_9ACTN|nr:acyl carrier protein [Streptomyces ficellus]QGV82346.1 acyl carrier protein [Streptomyces ficellus]